MSAGLILAAVVVTVLAAGFVIETIRVPKLESWCRDRGFVRLDTRSDRAIAELERALERFEDGSTSQWGFAMTGQASGLPIAIGEVDWRFGPKNRYWYTLAATTRSGADLPRMRIDSTSQALEGFSSLAELPLAPLVFLSSKTRWPGEKAELPRVRFPEDPEFDHAFNVFGDEAAVRPWLDADLRRALLSQRWRGRLVTSGNAVAWRCRGYLWPARADKMLALADVVRLMLEKG